MSAGQEIGLALPTHSCHPPHQIERPEADAGTLVLVKLDASEIRLFGIINVDDGAPASISQSRPARPDPKRSWTYAKSVTLPSHDVGDTERGRTPRPTINPGTKVTKKLPSGVAHDIAPAVTRAASRPATTSNLGGDDLPDVRYLLLRYPGSESSIAQ